MSRIIRLDAQADRFVDGGPSGPLAKADPATYVRVITEIRNADVVIDSGDQIVKHRSGQTGGAQIGQLEQAYLVQG